jgi:hypothetical protein
MFASARTCLYRAHPGSSYLRFSSLRGARAGGSFQPDERVRCHGFRCRTDIHDGSLVTSTAYFAISSLRAVNSELLARTTPTIWDFLIAVRWTRRNRSCHTPEEIQLNPKRCHRSGVDATAVQGWIRAGNRLMEVFLWRLLLVRDQQRASANLQRRKTASARLARFAEYRLA